MNEYWVEKGSIKAIEHKVEALTIGFYGYQEDRKEAVSLNEYLVGQGNQKANIRKVNGLAHGKYGYDKDWEAAVAFNEQLIEQGNEEAIIRKIKGLSGGIERNSNIASRDLPLYQKNLPQLKIWLEDEILKGTRWAYYLKAKCLKYGILGFEKDREAAIAYIKEHHIPY